jgi:hypothetical protein
MAGERVELVRDQRGVMWDALLYTPTVLGLGSAALILWYQGNQSFGYLLLFLASFFLIQGVHRVLGRLILLPASPVSLDITKQRVLLHLRNGQHVELVKNVRYFSDFAGKSFGLTGMDLNGARKQYVFHKGQFPSEESFRKVGVALKIYA